MIKQSQARSLCYPCAICSTRHHPPENYKKRLSKKLYSDKVNNHKRMSRNKPHRSLLHLHPHHHSPQILLPLLRCCLQPNNQSWTNQYYNRLTKKECSYKHWVTKELPVSCYKPSLISRTQPSSCLTWPHKVPSPEKQNIKYKKTKYKQPIQTKITMKHHGSNDFQVILTASDIDFHFAPAALPTWNLKFKLFRFTE